jgi:hypothetical protein
VTGDATENKEVLLFLLKLRLSDRGKIESYNAYQGKACQLEESFLTQTIPVCINTVTADSNPTRRKEV